jgi:hypothetical protein
MRETTIVRSFLLVCVITAVVLSPAQRRTGRKSTEGPLAGFTKSPTEHIIVEIDEPFVVRFVAGVIREDGNQDPFPGALFEIRGPGGSMKIRGAPTDVQGRFRLRHISAGTYKFKATLNGFQSVVGTIIVSPKAGKRRAIAIKLPIGV